VELRIDELAAGGDGVGRASDGRVIFVPFTAPGDHVRVQIVDHQARFSRGRVETLLAGGPARVDPICPVYGSCGGCTWQHVSYPAQLDAKLAIVTQALRRIGGLAPPTPTITPSPNPFGYRSRSRVLASRGRVGYRRRRSHALCATSRCPLLVEELDQSLLALAAESPADGEWELSLGHTSNGDPMSRVSRLPDRKSEPNATIDSQRLSLHIGGNEIGFSEGVFVQSNLSLLGPLVEAVHLAAGRGGLVFDLFAGAGFLTLGLAARFEAVVAVEANPTAARDLERNLADGGINGVSVLAESLEVAIANRSLEDFEPEVVVLDPPRTGLPDGAAEFLASMEPARFVYLSCDPATLARDLSVLKFWNYELTSVQAFDMFPQSPHVEVLAVAQRSD
jgi:23S rRNA (uracil1939-C5)-methyltransferase